MAEYNSVRQMAAATLALAYQDAQRLDPQAVAWLASRQAEPFFDLMQLPQSTFLLRSQWRTYAREAMAIAHDDLQPDWVDTIEASLEYLEGLSGGRVG